MSKKYNYYSVDAGHFRVQIKLCFDQVEFQKILIDHDIKAKTSALDEGIAETHYLSDGREGIIILVFDLDACDEGPAYLAGIIAHEATHCVCRIFEHIGEDVEHIGEESRAYLTEHIVAQLTQAVITEKEKNAGKRNRKLSKQKDKGDTGPVVQVDKHNIGSPRPDSYTQGPAVVSGVENTDGQTVSATKHRLQGPRRSGVSGGSHSEQVRRGETN